MLNDPQSVNVNESLKGDPEKELKRDGNSRGPLFQEHLSIGGGGAMHPSRKKC